ncbi:hypothetical protein ACP6PL_24110 [Dapis sp. BLCC M126]|uniref:hypothetical protein n=1 Tax=Dapis sp. BLCC M126 TaxID=3400189 RepID=UPI003CF73D82
MARNSSLAGILFVIFIAFCLLNTIFFGDFKIHLQCEQSLPGERYCQLTRTKLYGEVEETFKPGELKRAILDKDIVYDDQGGSTTYYKIMLETQKDKIPFGIRTSWIGDKKERVSQINDFLENTNTTLLDIEEDNLKTLFWSFIIELIGILFMFALIPIAHLCGKLYRGIRAKLVSILNWMNKQQQKAPLSFEKETQE